jgi:hypothetical protein
MLPLSEELLEIIRSVALEYKAARIFQEIVSLPNQQNYSCHLQ